MMQLIFALVAGALAAVTGYFVSLFFEKRAGRRDRVIEFSVSGGKRQRIKVNSLNPVVIKDAVEMELQLESFIRSSLKDLVRSNGKITVSEDDLADFVVRNGDSVVILEAKASEANMTDDFLPKLDSKFNNHFTILLVDKISGDAAVRESKNFKVIRRGKGGDFKAKFLHEISAALGVR